MSDLRGYYKVVSKCSTCGVSLDSEEFEADMFTDVLTEYVPKGWYWVPRQADAKQQLYCSLSCKDKAFDVILAKRLEREEERLRQLFGKQR